MLGYSRISLNGFLLEVIRPCLPATDRIASLTGRDRPARAPQQREVAGAEPTPSFAPPPIQQDGPGRKLRPSVLVACRSRWKSPSRAPRLFWAVSTEERRPPAARRETPRWRSARHRQTEGESAGSLAEARPVTGAWAVSAENSPCRGTPSRFGVIRSTRPGILFM